MFQVMPTFRMRGMYMYRFLCPYFIFGSGFGFDVPAIPLVSEITSMVTENNLLAWLGFKVGWGENGLNQMGLRSSDFTSEIELIVVSFFCFSFAFLFSIFQNP
ncbi:MAG: hypothetical protein H7835_18910 [Magnetococcus sp. XQGC-1]